MRYILVDWLMEVSQLKKYGNGTLYLAISLVDRYLRTHPLPKKELQLLGIASLVIAARFLEKDIVTIREAAWLTDKTYKYEQIVMQMGKILSTVRGNLIDINHHHIMKIMVEQMDLNRSERDLFMFMGDHLMLNMPLGLYSPYLLATTAWICTTAASDVTTHIWGPALELWTGQNLYTLAPAIAVCYADCINGLDRPVMDNRKQELKSVM